MIDVYEKVLDRTRELIDGSVGKLDAPAPSHDTAGGVVNHIIGGLHMFTLELNGQPIDFSAKPDFTDDPVNQFDQARKLAIDAFRAPGAMEKTVNIPAPNQNGAFLLGVALQEALVHGWDLAKATGQDGTIPDEIANVFLEQYKQRPIPDAMRGGGLFGPEVQVPADASASDRLVAYLGRNP